MKSPAPHDTCATQTMRVEVQESGDIVDSGETLEYDSHMGRGRAREAGPGSGADRADELRGTLIGRFVILSKLGEGGMGVVYAAYDSELDRKVAIKLLRPSQRGGTAMARLVREAQALARVSHPNVVQIHQIGEHRGAVFIAMEYVGGRTLREWLKEPAGRPWRETLEVLVQAGRGLAAAHEADLVHRDFKPDNVIVADDGRVRVLDFGLVRDVSPAAAMIDNLDSGYSTDTPPPRAISEVSVVQGPRSSKQQLTQTGAIMGTPAYMALEQLAGDQVDSMTDQFAFCVVMFEALYGERPFYGRTVPELTAKVVAGKTQPRPPKSKVPRAVHEATLRGLNAEPEERWPDMSALLGELERALARRKTAWWWSAVGATAAVVASIMIATPMVRGLLDRINEQDRALAQSAEALEQRNAHLSEVNTDLDQANAELTTALDIQKGLTAALTADADSPDQRLTALYAAIQVYGRYAQADAVPPSIEAGIFAVTRRLHHSRELAGHEGEIVDLAFSPNGELLATASRDHTAKLWDARSGTLLETFNEHVDELLSVEFAADGERLLTTSVDASATLWRVDTGAVLKIIDDHEINAARFSPTGHELAIGASDGSVSLWTAAPGREIEQVQVFEGRGGVRALEFSRDGRRLLAAADDGHVSLWELDSGHGTTVEFGGGAPRSLALAHDGSQIAVATDGGSVKLWSQHTGALVPIAEGARSDVQVVAFAPDGRRLLSVGLDGPPRLWDTSSGALVAELEGHPQPATDAAFSPDGGQIATVSYDASLRLCDAESGRVLELLPGQAGVVERVVFDGQGQRLATVGRDRVVRVWEARAASERALTQGSPHSLAALALARDSSRIAMAERGGGVSVWDAQTGQGRAELDAKDTVLGLAFSPDGHLLATGSKAGHLGLWDAASGALILELPKHGGDVTSLAFSPAGEQLVTGDMQGELRLWAIGDGELVAQWRGVEVGDGVSALVFSPDGQHIAGGSVLGLGPVKVWDVFGNIVHTLPVEGMLFALAFSPDGQRLASAGARKEVRIWALQSGLQVAELVGDGPNVHALAFSPDGAHLVAGGDSRVRLWELGQGAAVAELGSHETQLSVVAFSADGQFIYSGSRDGRVVRVVATGGQRMRLACEALRHDRAYAEVEAACAEGLLGRAGDLAPGRAIEHQH